MFLGGHGFNILFLKYFSVKWEQIYQFSLKNKRTEGNSVVIIYSPSIFYQIFIFSPNDSPSKTVKNVSISPKKLFSFSRYSNFCNFTSSFPCFPYSKEQMEVEQFMSWIGLHKFAGVNFGTTQELLYITPSNLVWY